MGKFNGGFFIHACLYEEVEWFRHDGHEGIMPFKKGEIFEDTSLLLVKHSCSHLPQCFHRQVVATHLADWAKKKQDHILFTGTFGPKAPVGKKRPFSLWNFLFPQEYARAHMSTHMYGDECIVGKIKDVRHFFHNQPFAWWIQEKDDPLWIKILLKDQGFRRLDFFILRVSQLSSVQKDFLSAHNIWDQNNRMAQHKQSFCMYDNNKMPRIFLLAYYDDNQFVFLCPKDSDNHDNPARLLIQTFEPSKEMEEISLFIWDGVTDF